MHAFVPYISVALITGLGHLDFNEVKRLAVKGGSLLLLLWLIAITLLVLLPFAYPDWPSRSLFQRSSIQEAVPPDFLQLYIPSNPLFSLAKGIVPAVVLFSIMIGLALTGSKNKALLLEPLNLVAELLSKITSFVSRLAPIGIFALIANTMGTMSFAELARLQVYVMIAILMLLILGLWLLPGLVSSVTPLRHRDILRGLRTPLVTAFATGSRFATVVSVMHYTAIALIGTFALEHLLHFRWERLLRLLAVTAVLVTATLFGVRAFYTYVVVVPYTQDQLLRGRHHLRAPQPAVVHREPPAGTPATDFQGGPRALAEIQASGTLRVCYGEGNYPLVFFNDDGELVGFDTAMAHRFASRIGVKLEFLPVTGRYDLITGYCDALINSIALNVSTADNRVHTEPFDAITLAFIVPNKRREEFSTWSDIRAQGEITVALSFFQTLEYEVKNVLPQANAVRLWSLAEQTRYFESGGTGAEALLDAAEEGAAWTILYPMFSVVVPRPVVRLPVVYAVAPNNSTLLWAMNEWLLIERATGGIDELYDYWVQGEIGALDPPRWSVIRNVLGWVK